MKFFYTNFLPKKNRNILCKSISTDDQLTSRSAMASSLYSHVWDNFRRIQGGFFACDKIRSDRIFGGEMAPKSKSCWNNPSPVEMGQEMTELYANKVKANLEKKMFRNFFYKKVCVSGCEIIKNTLVSVSIFNPVREHGSPWFGGVCK